MIESLATLSTPPDPSDLAARTTRRLPVGAERDRREAIVTDQRTAELGALIDAWLARPGRAPTLDIWTSTGADAIDPIEHLARRFGPYELSMTTFSVADSSLRRVRNLREAGHLTAVLIVADALMLSGPRANTAAAIRQTADRWAMVATHAKAYVLWPAARDAPAWTINGSATLTHNPRCETIQVSD